MSELYTILNIEEFCNAPSLSITIITKLGNTGAITPPLPFDCTDPSLQRQSIMFRLKKALLETSLESQVTETVNIFSLLRQCEIILILDSLARVNSG